MQRPLSDHSSMHRTWRHCAVNIFFCSKLYCYGIRGIAHKWFISYLSSRQQSVMYNGHESEFKMMRCGVPEGSILGPLLFLLYINELTAVSNFFMPILFADDTNLFCTGTDLKDMIRQINEEMAKIYAWVNANKLSLNIDKTNFMMFMPKGFLIVPTILL